MAVFYLIRHGNTDMVGRALPGRMPGVHLNREGESQAAQLAQRLSVSPIALICCSPLERARETAEPIARQLGVEVRLCEGLTEVDAGEWTGCEIRDLLDRRRWQEYNLFRSGIRIPGGELMTEVQARMVTAIERLRDEYPQGRVAVVSHGDPIKATLAHYAGVPLDLILRLEISPASVSILSIHDHGPQLLCINNTTDLPCP